MSNLTTVPEPTAKAAASYIHDLQAKMGDTLASLLPDEPFAHLDYSDIKNVGDAAIWLGELAFFRKHLKRSPSYTSMMTTLSPDRLNERLPEGPIFLRGGGNFGDIWVGHQRFRERVLQQWPGRLVVQMPQSIHFDSADRLDEARRIIDAHGNFLLVVRDRGSLEFAEKHFDCRTLLCPDMAFSIGQTAPLGEVKFPILAMLRDDREMMAGVDRHVDANIPCEDWINEDPWPVRIAAARGALAVLSTLNRRRLRGAIYEAKARQRFERGVRQISRAQTVITDRLHVHIISILLGKEHAVLDNSYGKIGRFRAAFPEPPGLTYAATSYEDAEAWAKQRS